MPHRLNCMIAGILCVALGQTAKADDAAEAEKLFHAMKEKLANAKTLQFEFELAVKDEKRDQTVKGKILLGENDKARVETVGKCIAIPENWVLVSDGEKVVETEADRPAIEHTSHKNTNYVFRVQFGRKGVFSALIGLTAFELGEPELKDGKVEEFETYSEFKLAVREKINGREAHRIDYIETCRRFPIKAACTVWVDTKTGLPVKRMKKSTDPKEEGTITETYSNIKLDGKIDESKFALPK